MENKGVVVVALKLFIITAVAALCLAAVNMVTKPIIADNAVKTQTEAKKSVLPEAKEFKELSFSESDIPKAAENGVSIEEFNAALADGNGVGYVVTAVSNAGYGGDIRLMIGLDNELKVKKVQILSSSETPGLGGNASKPSFIDQFIGKGGELKVVKGSAGADSEISAISSATITSKAVTACVNGALELAESQVKAEVNVENADETNETTEDASEENTEENTEEAE